MVDISTMLQQGTINYWLFIPSAIALGALHGLEPGHSKTMMAAFIIAIRGTVAQAVMLGLAATFSHTAVVWMVALAGLYFGSHWNMETTEPYFQLASCALIIAVALWMIVRTWRHRHHAHVHDHPHHDHIHHTHTHSHEEEEIAEINLVASHMDAHERAHAEDIRRRFSGTQVTTGQIILFGLTGGLIPCPASITVLLLCLQLKKIALGVSLVLCFSIGIALTMVFSGVVAALSVKQLASRWSGFETIAYKAPFISGTLIILVGLYIGGQGITGLMH